MKIKLLTLGLICFFILSCGIPMKTKTYSYPGPAESLYDQMIPILLEMGFEIIQTDKPSLTIIAGKSKTMAYHKVTINFVNQEDKTSLLIQVTLPGKTGPDNLGWCEKTANEIAQKFEERIKK